VSQRLAGAVPDPNRLVVATRDYDIAPTRTIGCSTTSSTHDPAHSIEARRCAPGCRSDR
jgi:hypothetical protein